ncbi:hypothetical protein IJG14_01275 [bacterium]|nr:hypothetical protein [bacterium]
MAIEEIEYGSLASSTLLNNNFKDLGYKEQYDRAYKILIEYTSGLKKEQRVYW